MLSVVSSVFRSFQHANYVWWTVPNCFTMHANYVCWNVPDYVRCELGVLIMSACELCMLIVPDFFSMRIMCAKLFLIVSSRKLCGLNCSWLFQYANYVAWTVPDFFSMRIRCEELFLCGIVPDCVSMRIKCSELFLIVSACELCVLNCSWLFQHANYVCWTVPDLCRLRIMCAAELFLFVSACELCVLNCSRLFQHANYVCWAVPACFIAQIMWPELFLIVSVCELCVLNSSWFFSAC